MITLKHPTGASEREPQLARHKVLAVELDEIVLDEIHGGSGKTAPTADAPGGVPPTKSTTKDPGTVTPAADILGSAGCTSEPKDFFAI